MKMDIWRPFRRMWIGEPCSPMVFKIPKAELEAQLRRAVDSSFLGFGARGLRGSVRNGGVTAYWNTPGFGNSWRPVFRGTIVGDDRESRLEGRFSVFRFVQVFSAFWFGFLVLFGILALPTVVGTLAALGMFALGVGLLNLSERMSGKEREKIIAAFGELGASGSPSGSTARVPPAWAMRSAAAVVGFLSVADLIATAFKTPSPWYLTVANFALGVLGLSVAYGIFAKRRYAWRLGFVFIWAGTVITAFDQFPAMSRDQGINGPFPQLFMGIACVLVTGYWTILWRGQRTYFLHRVGDES